MQWFIDLRIRKKLFLSYIVFGIVSVVIGWAGYHGMNVIMTEQDAMHDVGFVQMRLLSDINTSLLMARGDIRVAMYTKDDARRKKYLASAIDHSKKVMTYLDRFQQMPMTPEQKDSIQLLRKTWTRYCEVREPVLSLIRDGKDDEAQPLMDGEISRTMIRARTLLVSLNDQLTDIVELQNADADHAAVVAGWELLLVIGFGILLIFGFATAISRIVGNPLKRGAAMMKELTKGNLQVRVNLDSKDEIGELTHGMDVFADTLQGVVKHMHLIANGDLRNDMDRLDERDEIVPALIEIMNSLRALVAESTMLTNAAVEGQLSVRGDAAKFKGGYREIVEGVNSTLDQVITPLQEGAIVLQAMAKGDLTARVTGEFKGDHQLSKNSINALGESLDKAMSDVTEAVAATANASSEISASTEEMAAGAQEQTKQAADVSGAIDEMTKTIMDTSKNASLAAETARTAGDNAKDGGKVMMDTISGMNRIADVVKLSAATVEELGRSSDQIGEIVQVIDDIADQTNLLALNAAIEAARAGEQGRGFAVVADEVRKLAERTTKATKEIAVMIRQIQKDTANAVTSMQTGTDEVEKGKVMADKAGESLREIIAGAGKVVDVATQVAAASEEQSAAAEEIGKNIDAISNVTAQSASGTQHIAQAAEDLNRLTLNLQDLLAQFTLSKNGTQPARSISASLVVRNDGKLTRR